MRLLVALHLLIALISLGSAGGEDRNASTDVFKKSISALAKIPRHPQSHLAHLTGRRARLTRKLQRNRFKTPAAKERVLWQLRKMEARISRLQKEEGRRREAAGIRLRSKGSKRRIAVKSKKSKKSDKENRIVKENVEFARKEDRDRAIPTSDLRCRNCRQRCVDGKCACFEGFRLSTDLKRCYDINECLDGNGGCSDECQNKVGHYFCKCGRGYKLDVDAKTCIDSNECLLNNGHGPCEDTCANTVGSFACSCRRPNTVLSGNGLNCRVIDECASGRSGCSHLCIHSNRGPFCSCPDGLALGPDYKTCQDVDECKYEKVLRICPNCINAYGSYVCLERGISNVTCPALGIPAAGFFDCSRERSVQSSIKWISDRELRLNKPGTICHLECPVSRERKQIVCNGFGNWVPNNVSC